MDFPTHVKRVSTEPTMVNAYDTYVLSLSHSLLDPNTAYVKEYLIPDDGYVYQLAELDWYVPRFYPTDAFPGPVFVWGGFSLVRDPPSWTWISGGWCYSHVTHSPAKLGMIAHQYPSAYGMYVWNSSSK